MILSIRDEIYFLIIFKHRHRLLRRLVDDGFSGTVFASNFPTNGFGWLWSEELRSAIDRFFYCSMHM